MIAERTHSQVVQVIGKKIVLYKPKTKIKKKSKDDIKTAKTNTKQQSKLSAKNKLKSTAKQQSKKNFKNKTQKDTEEGFKNKAKNAASKNNNNSRSMEAKNGSRKKSSRNYGGNI